MSAPAKVQASARLLLHEAAKPSGELVRTWLELGDGQLGFRQGDADPVLIPPKVLAGVMRRYGRAVAEDTLVSGPELQLPTGERLTLLRHLARFDVIAKDYLVYEAPGELPLAELATGVTAALAFVLGRLPASE